MRAIVFVNKASISPVAPELMELSFKMFDSDSIFKSLYTRVTWNRLHVQLSIHAKLFAVCAIFRSRHFGAILGSEGSDNARSLPSYYMEDGRGSR